MVVPEGSPSPATTAARLAVPIVIGSRSKWRRELAESLCKRLTDENPQLQTELHHRSPDIDEEAIRDHDPEELVRLLGRAKADAVVALRDPPPRSIIFTGDLVAVYDGKIREKPVDAEQNVAFLQDYRGSHVDTVCSVVIHDTLTAFRAEEVRWARTFYSHELSDDVIQRVVLKGDSMLCSGGFVVNDPDLRKYVVRIEGGDEDSVCGFPAEVVERLLVAALTARRTAPQA